MGTGEDSSRPKTNGSEHIGLHLRPSWRHAFCPRYCLIGLGLLRLGCGGDYYLVDGARVASDILKWIDLDNMDWRR
jgi:hypothetical protein